MKKLLLSVVIPTYQRLDLLSVCLERLNPVTQTIGSHSYEVIVTDDGQSVQAKAMIAEQYPWARWAPGPRRGPAANRNNGARQAIGEWLVFIDDDCIPDPGCLAAYEQAFQANSTASVFEGCTYVDRPRRSLAETAPLNESGGCLWSCNFAIRRDLFEEIGGFDPAFPYACMEDVELRIRLEKRQVQQIFLKEASVCHPWRQTKGWKAVKQYQESIFILLRLHPEMQKSINSRYYLSGLLRPILTSTLPGMIKFRGAGLGQAVIEHLGCLQMIVLTLIYPTGVNR